MQVKNNLNYGIQRFEVNFYMKEWMEIFLLQSYENKSMVNYIKKVWMEPKTHQKSFSFFRTYVTKTLHESTLQKINFKI
jgi:hypothetical protein